MNTRRINMIVAGALIVFGLCACDDETTAASESPAMSVLESGKKMDACSKDNAGEMVYVSDSAAVFYCAEGEWQILNGKDGADGKDGENSADGQGSLSSRDTVVVNQKDTVVVRDTVVVVNRDTVVIKESSGSGSSESSGTGTSLTGKTNWVYLNPAISYGEITDERDGQVYKTVKIGDQVWMAENLNYAYTGVPYDYGGYTSDAISWCNKCTKYGRLYTWAAAMDSVGTWSANGSGCGDGKECSPTYPVRGICPSGWHLPSRTEVDALLTAVGHSSRLKSVIDWYQNGSGTDSFGFSALPAGISRDGGSFWGDGSEAYFWCSTESDSGSAYRMHLYYKSGGDPFLKADGKYLGYSVRCVQD